MRAAFLHLAPVKFKLNSVGVIGARKNNPPDYQSLGSKRDRKILACVRRQILALIMIVEKSRFSSSQRAQLIPSSIRRTVRRTTALTARARGAAEGARRRGLAVLCVGLVWREAEFKSTFAVRHGGKTIVGRINQRSSNRLVRHAIDHGAVNAVRWLVLRLRVLPEGGR